LLLTFGFHGTGIPWRIEVILLIKKFRIAEQGAAPLSQNPVIVVIEPVEPGSHGQQPPSKIQVSLCVNVLSRLK
jgi:hypothetical protein